MNALSGLLPCGRFRDRRSVCRPGSRAAAAMDPASPARSLPGTEAVPHERENSTEGEVKTGFWRES
jgi:hypothetical protein